MVKVKQKVEILVDKCDICAKTIDPNVDYKMSFIEKIIDYLVHTYDNETFEDLSEVYICSDCSKKIDKNFANDLHDFIKDFINKQVEITHDQQY